MSDEPEPPHTSGVRSASLARVQAALMCVAADMLNTRAGKDLIEALLDVEDAGHPGDAATALSLLTADPQVVLRLDAHVREVHRCSYRFTATVARLQVIDSMTTAGPITVALASCHPDGQVRARVVRLLLNRTRNSPPALDLLPFLVLRTTDWAAPVRDMARAALSLVLDAAPTGLVEAAARVTIRTERRLRGDFAHQQVLTALLALPGTAHFDRLLGSPDRRLRRFTLSAALMARRLPAERLVALAETDGDRRVRELAAEGAVRDAVWTERHDLVRRLAAGRAPEVRAVALTGWLRAGRIEEVIAHFDDPAKNVREVAHEAIRRSGADVSAHYRAALREAMPSPGAIAGLADIGDRTDSGLLEALLAHPRAKVRAAASRTLRALDIVAV
ncbi:hypothetical protein [Kitasatospora sp. McL0602]|uniref:hypothetical protein n=1 Tax=Kitasatospora sp. McL0602 TaxID=3439530 RepID=UPI003F8AF28B